MSITKELRSFLLNQLESIKVDETNVKGYYTPGKCTVARGSCGQTCSGRCDGNCRGLNR